MVEKKRTSCRVEPDARLDQHFLSAEAAEAVIASADIRSDDVVLDIGAGTGALIVPISVRHPRWIYAVEIDHRLEPRLDTLALRHPALQLLWSDLRDLDPASIADVTVAVTNPPFSLLSQTVDLFGRLPSLRYAVMVVGDRWSEAAHAAPTSEQYSRISLAVQSRFTVQPVGGISGDQFTPPIAGKTTVLRLGPAVPTDSLLAELAHSIEHHAGMRVKTFLRRARSESARAARILRESAVRALQQRRLVALNHVQFRTLVAAIVRSADDTSRISL